jgi:hypothetical protein
VSGLRFRGSIYGLGFRVWIYGLRCRVWGFRDRGSWFRIEGLGLRAKD